MTFQTSTDTTSSISNTRRIYHIISTIPKNTTYYSITRRQFDTSH